jgi:sugar phosphate isomerase/epimerase
MIGRAGIDTYGLLPLDLDPIEILEWAHRHGAGMVQFSGFAGDRQLALADAQLDEIAAAAREFDLHLEWGGAQHIPRDPTTWRPRDLIAHNRLVARQAARLGCRIVRSCSSGLMRWTDAAPPTELLLAETAAAIAALCPMLEDHGVVLAIETHFEFTSFELLRLFESAGVDPGGCAGICLDTMNLMTMIEEPVAATGRLLPWVVATHVKDGGVLVEAEGLLTFPAPLGRGVIDLPDIVRRLDGSPVSINLAVESHGGSFLLPIYDRRFLSRFPDLTPSELAALVRMAARTREQPDCRPLPREAWPAVCEARVAADLAALATLAAPGLRTTASDDRGAASVAGSPTRLANAGPPVPSTATSAAPTDAPPTDTRGGRW